MPKREDCEFYIIWVNSRHWLIIFDVEMDDVREFEPVW